jgi:hypothetical protein
MKHPLQHLAIVRPFNMGQERRLTLSRRRHECKKAPALQRSLTPTLIGHLVSCMFLTVYCSTYLATAAGASSNPRKRTREPERSPTPAQNSRQKARSRSPRRLRTPARRSPSLDNRSSLARQSTRSPSRTSERRSRSQSRRPFGDSGRSSRAGIEDSVDEEYADADASFDRSPTSEEEGPVKGYTATRCDPGKHSKSGKIERRNHASPLSQDFARTTSLLTNSTTKSRRTKHQFQL